MRCLFFCFTTLAVLLFSSATANDTTAVTERVWSAYMEQYACWSSAQNRFDPLYVSYAKPEALRMNVAFIQCAKQFERWRFSAGVMTGTYVNRNFSSESKFVRPIQSLNVSANLDRAGRHQIQAGIGPSHIGYEGPVGQDQLMLTRSLLAENTPYSENMLKYSVQWNNAWSSGFFVLHGWQRLGLPNHWSDVAYGTQVTYKGSRLTMNHSTFLGGVKTPNSADRRYFQNLWAEWKPNVRWHIVGEVDQWFTQHEDTQHKPNASWGMSFNASRPLNTWLRAGARVEYIDDHAQTVFRGGENWIPKGGGYAACFDVLFAQHGLFRLELKQLWMRNQDAPAMSQELRVTGSLSWKY